MKQLWLVLIVVLVSSTCAACQPAAAPAPTAGPARLQTLRMELPVDANIADLSRLMAADMLRAQGYTIEVVDLNDNALSVQALEQGDLDLAYISSALAWTAIARGARIRTIIDDVADTRILAVVPGIKSCRDLNGKKVAVASATSTQAMLINKYIKTNCPGVAVELVVLAGNTSRFAALTSGQVDAVAMNLTDVRSLEVTQKTTVALLDEYTGQYQNLRGSTQVTRIELIEKYPETAKDIVRALLQSRRELDDPKVMTEKAIQYLDLDPAEAAELRKIYQERQLWDPNGGFTPEILQENLDFFKQAGGVPQELTLEQVADLTILNAVLDEIGRK